jgi:hypothetical protein
MVELILAMGFVAALLIAIAMTVIQIGNIYNRGLTLKEVDQAGRLISSELQRSIAASTPFYIDPGVGNQYIQQQVGVFSHFVKKDWGGRLCLGQYSYIWNYGDAIRTVDPSLNLYDNISSDVNIPRFVKVLDPKADYCFEDPSTGWKKIDTTTEDPVELLDKSQHNLAIHSFTITTTSDATDPKTGQQLYNVEFIIGTNDRSALESNMECKPPNDSESNLDYCSINRFNIVARAGNKIQ